MRLDASGNFVKEYQPFSRIMLEESCYSDKHPGKNPEEHVSNQNTNRIEQRIVDVNYPIGIPQDQGDDKLSSLDSETDSKREPKEIFWFQV